MESPVRIKSGAAVLVAVCIFLEICNGYPNQNVNELEASNEHNSTDLETSTLFIRPQTKSNGTFRFLPRNNTIWKFQRKNSPNVTHYVTPTPSLVYNITTAKSNDSESVVSTTPSGSKISFRGSVKYFTTRTPFKPKIPYMRRNITNLKDDSSEISSVNITTTTRLPIILKNRFKTTTRIPALLKDSFKSTRVPLKDKIKTTTSKPIETVREKQNSIESTTKHRSANRSESSKSLDFSFNIDKYTSDEFHDINNVYSQSVSPEVEHFIVPENVSDYFVSVGSGSFVPPAENNYRSSKPSKSSTVPHIDFFDRRFKEVSDSIKQNLADADYANDDKSTALDTSETDIGNVNFEELLAQPANNNTQIMYQNTKELIINDSKNPSKTHMDFTGSNGTKIFYEMSMISTETYDVTSTTVRPAPTVSEAAQQNEITTPSSSATNRVVKFASADNKVTRDEPSVTRRIDHFKTNGTRKEFLATIRMRAHTTPKPRIRISLKTNRNQQNTTVSGNKTEDASTAKPPEIVKMFPFTRRRTTLTTVSSNIDPVLQETNSPSKFVDHTKSESDNTIPTLRKRGSVMLDQDAKNSTKNESELTSQFTIPPTAWALITLRDTPIFKKQNLSNSSEPSAPLQADNVIKTEDDLQKLDKPSESHSVSSNTQPVFEKFGATSASKISLQPSDNTSSASIEGNKLNIQVTSPSNSISVSNEGFNRSRESLKPEDREKEIVPDSEHSYSAFESITKLPSAITTPAYEEIPDSTPADFTSEDDYYSPTSADDSNDDNVEDFTIETVDTSTTERIDRNKNISSAINGNLDSTTLQSIPLAELFTFPSEEPPGDDSTTFLYTTTEAITNTNTVGTPKDVKTSKSLTSTNVMDFDTMTSTLETFTTVEDSNTIMPLQNVTSLNVDNSKRTSTKYTDDSTDGQELSTLSTTDMYSNENIVLKNIDSTTMPYSGAEINTKATITDEDGLDDFSFSTFYSNIPTVLTSPTPSKQPTEFSNAFDITTTEIKNTSQDIEAASTMYYGSTRTNIDDTTTTTFSHTTNSEDTESSTMRPISNTESTTVFVTVQTSSESREGKHKIVIDDEDKTTNAINSSDQNPDDWVDTPDPNADTKVLDGREILNKINKTIPENESVEIDTEFNSSDNDVPTIVKNENQPDLRTPQQTNIEVIKSNLTEVLPDAAESLPGQTTTMFGEDEKFDTVDGTGAIAAITISAIGIVALLLLIGLLVVARGRRTAGGYGQRCTPVSLDSYSLDNVSVNGSTRRKARRASKRSYGNPAYDESGATSHPMQFAALANFSLDQESIVSEFNEIPVITVRADEVPPGCESKNRFSNVIPLPETRVFLKPLPGDETSDYINANYVRGPKNLKNYYIACQAPMASTVNDFWRMIWEQNSRVILMLTEFMENGVEKCFEYIPPSEVSDNRRVFGDYKVTVKKREIRDKYIISQLQLKSLATRTWREVTHMWYFWPAKGVPEECHSIIAFLIEARSYLKASQNAKEFDEDGHDSLVTQNGSMATNQTQISMDPDDNNSNEDSEVNVYNVQRGEKTKNGVAKNGTLNYNDSSQKRGGPLVVHCSPGTGRTGAVIACDIGIRDFEMARTVDVPKTVYRIRRDRANGVQTKDQYIFIYKVLSEYATKLTGGVLDSI